MFKMRIILFDRFIFVISFPFDILIENENTEQSKQIFKNENNSQTNKGEKRPMHDQRNCTNSTAHTI